MLGQHSAYSFVELPVGNKVAVYLWPEISVSFPHLLRGRPGGSRTLAVSETFRDIWFSDEGKEVDLTTALGRDGPDVASFALHSLGWIHLSQGRGGHDPRSEEHTSELQSLMRISYAVFCLKKKKQR